MQFLLLLINKKACKLKLKFSSELMRSQAHRKAATNISCRCCPLHLESHASPPWSLEIFHIPPEGPHCPRQPQHSAQRDNPETTSAQPRAPEGSTDPLSTEGYLTFQVLALSAQNKQHVTSKEGLLGSLQLC